MSGKEIDTNWLKWLKENLDRGCNPYDLYVKLLENEFSQAAIRKAMGSHYPQASANVLQTGGECIDFQALAKPPLVNSDRQMGLMQIISDKLQIYMIDDFLNEDEISNILDVINRHLRPSTITIESSDKSYRTSATSDLSLLTNHVEKEIVKNIDEKISRTLGINLTYSEGMQAQRYQIGQQFKKHTDFFAPGSAEYETYASEQGQRTWTFMVYLSDVAKGGGTHFFSINKTFSPKKGRAVIWNNLNPDGSVNYNTLHAGLPVEEGEKTIITKWFRTNGHGSVFHQDV